MGTSMAAMNATDSTKDIATLVAQIRSMRSLTQEGLAHELGVAFSTVNAWEQGRSEPQLRHRERILDLHRQLHEVSAESGFSKVLCVEDSALDRRHISTLVEDAAAMLGLALDVISEQDAMGALLTLGRAQPAVAFIDVGMPGLDGLSLAERIGSMELPVGRLVFVTARRDDEFEMRAQDMGLLLLDKPITLSAMGAVLRSVVQTEGAAASTQLEHSG